jgi:hypothetical protein
MLFRRLLLFATCQLALAISPLLAQKIPSTLPPPDVPAPLGVNIHFTDPRPGEMEMLARGGFRWVRMDFGWGATERARGRYDFAAYDRLMAALDKRSIRAVFILDYSNPLYDSNQSPNTDEGRAAMAQWAAAAVKHFAGHGVVWEMYNEPNISFWRPKPNVDDYVKLALAVGKAIRAVAPKELYVGPATSTIDFAFLESCFRAGLLELWDAVSVHPYRQTEPESVEDEYRRLRLLIAKYAPKGKQIPILSGEWGYSAGWAGMDETKQGRMLARQWLLNLANDIPISIWYDWHDDGTDPKEPEHHFGTVRNAYRSGDKDVYEPKPTYLAAGALSTTLKACRFNNRLWTGSPDDYVLLFDKGHDVRIAAWTRSRELRTVHVAASPGRFAVTSHLGQALPLVSADSAGLAIVLKGDPVYLAPEQPNDVLRTVAGWRRLPQELVGHAPSRGYLTAAIENVTPKPIRLDYGGQRLILVPKTPVDISKLYEVSRSPAPIEVVMKVELNGMAVTQRTEVVVQNPLTITPLAPTANGLPVRIGNPSGEAVSAEVTATPTMGTSFTEARAAVMLAAGQIESVVFFPIPLEQLMGADLAFGLHEEKQGFIARPGNDFETEAVRVAPVTVSGLTIATGGDAKVAAEVKLKDVPAPDGLPSIYGVPTVRRIEFRFDPGWKFLVLRPGSGAAIPGRPRRFGVWLYGDGSGNIPRLRFTDSTGQTFQPDGEAVRWTGWRWVTFAMEGARSGHWGGAQDGQTHYPIRWDSLFLLDNAARDRTSGTVYLFGPTLFY